MIEQSFLDSGFSFTASKLLPYVITLMIGLIIVFLLRRRLNFKFRIVRILVKLVIVAIPFIVYFAFNPIYEGDFSNNSELVQKTSGLDELNKKTLYVISIPGCPFCKDALTDMIVLKNRNPSINIEFLVCSNEEKSLEFYKEVNSGNKINITLAKNPDALLYLAQHQFPAFAIVENNKVKRWSNQNFGVRAMDEVESVLN